MILVQRSRIAHLLAAGTPGMNLSFGEVAARRKMNEAIELEPARWSFTPIVRKVELSDTTLDVNNERTGLITLFNTHWLVTSLSFDLLFPIAPDFPCSSELRFA